MLGTIKEQREVTARKDHMCCFCNSKIRKGTKYQTSTHKWDGEIYDWKIHTKCQEIARTMDMYERASEDGHDGLTEQYFQEEINDSYDNLLLAMFKEEDFPRLKDVANQIHRVRFSDKLDYIIRHYENKNKKEVL